MNSSKRVAILGASNKPDRYAYKAFKMLIEKGYETLPINPIINSIDGIQVYKSISDIKDPIHTLTIYMNPQKWSQYLDDIVKMMPMRVICNPGTESTELEEKLRSSGIDCIEACTLVLLRTNRF